jgi:predicted MFS family arabinose efflux permease
VPIPEPVPPAVPSTEPSVAPPAAPAERAKRATSVAFAAAGFVGASWASRIPQLRDGLGLTPATLGLVLLAVAVGSVLALPLAGPVVTRVGSRRVVASMAGLVGVALALLAVGSSVSVWLVVAALFLIGLGNGTWDVAMNVQGAVVERRLGRSIMARFHAGFSVGTVAGAVVGVLLVATGVSVTVHLLLVAVAVAVTVPWSVRVFLPDVSPSTDPDSPARERRRSAFAAWRERRTLLVGVFVLAFTFAEGTGQDWIAVSVVDGYGASAALGTLAFATFLSAMTAGRWFGPAFIDRYGRVAVVRALALVGIAGLLLFVLGRAAGFAFAGAALWGLGTSLGFPVGMTAGADEPRYAAARVSVIASIGYCAFLAGPPVIGFLGSRVTVLHALAVTAVLLALAATLSPVVRERQVADGPVSSGR